MGVRFTTTRVATTRYSPTLHNLTSDHPRLNHHHPQQQYIGAFKLVGPCAIVSTIYSNAYVYVVGWTAAYWPIVYYSQEWKAVDCRERCRHLVIFAIMLVNPLSPHVLVE